LQGAFPSFDLVPDDSQIRDATRSTRRRRPAERAADPADRSNGNRTNRQRFSHARARAGKARGEEPGGRGETPPALPKARPRNIP